MRSPSVSARWAIRLRAATPPLRACRVSLRNPNCPRRWRWWPTLSRAMRPWCGRRAGFSKLLTKPAINRQLMSPRSACKSTRRRLGCCAACSSAIECALTSWALFAGTWKKRNTIGENMASESNCPFTGGAQAHTNKDWWPNQLNLQVLHQHSSLSNPMGEAFNYAKEFKSLDLNAVIEDLRAPGDFPAVFLFDRPQEPARLVEVHVVRPAIDGRKTLL